MVLLLLLLFPFPLTGSSNYCSSYLANIPILIW
jgi:hypothetical protein